MVEKEIVCRKEIAKRNRNRKEKLGDE